MRPRSGLAGILAMRRSLPLLVLLLGSIACGGARDPAERALVADSGPAPERTEAGVLVGCTCITPEEWNLFQHSTCDGPRFSYGCREAPQPFDTVFDAPPDCWRRHVVDPQTGCLMPDPRGCTTSCHPFGSSDAGQAPTDAR